MQRKDFGEAELVQGNDYELAGRRVVLLLVGGSKKRQNRDIKTAQELWAAYQEDQGGN